MFNKEEFVTDYVAAVKAADEAKEIEVLARLTSDQDFNDRKELVEGILKGVEALEGEHPKHKAFLEDQLEKIEAQLIGEDAEKVSASEDGKDESKPEEESKDDSADASADNADEKEAEASTPVAKSEGEAPAEEEKTEKSEQ